MTKSIEEILAVATDPAYHRVVTAKIALVPQALRDEHAELSERLEELVKARDTVDIPAAQLETAERLAAIEAELEASTAEFRFRCIGHRAWQGLLREHPPTKEQLTVERRLEYNFDTFPYEAIAASCSEPAMTADQARALEDSGMVDVAAWSELWGACLRANVADAAPKSLAAGLILRRNGGSATTAANVASLAASSSDE